MHAKAPRDVCCGTGDMSILLARYIKSSKNITGIDSASQALLVARERLNRIIQVWNWQKTSLFLFGWQRN